MADSSPYTKPHFTIRPKPNLNKGKSYSGFLFKSLIFALFIIVLPLFPSQAPEFVNQTILTQLWELLHLLFIGIAVAYGLFSRRNVDPDIQIEAQSVVDNTSCYVSTMFPVSSVFSDEGENPCGYDENGMMMMHCDWNYSQYCDSNNALMVMDEQYKPQLSPPEDNFSDVVYDGTNVVQAWNSEYNHRQSMVVMAHPYYTIGECDEIVGYKPLGLPVRSLKSTAGDLDSPGNNTNESDSSSCSRDSSRSSVKSRDRKFGDLGPFDSDEKFNDASGSSSLVPWRSRSRKMKNEENHGKFSDATASASIPWQDKSDGVEIEENYGEFDNVAGSASPIPWHSRSRKITNEESHGKFSDTTAPASSIPWQERYGGVEQNHGEFDNDAPWRSRSRWKKIEESRGKYSDAAASASYITWQEESQGVEVEENDGETNDVTGSASPIPWQAMSSWMESEGNHEKFNDGVGSSSIQWQESFGRMEFEENQGDFAESASPISWEPMSQAVETGENHRIFNDAPGSLSPIPWHSRSKRMEESEENHGNITNPSHFRPGSAAEPNSESFNSQVFRSTASLSSHRSTYSSDSVSSDNVNFESEEMGKKKSADRSSSEKMKLQEEDLRANMAYRGSSPRLRKMATREKYATVSDPSHHGSSSEKMNFQEEDSGANMASHKPSLRLKKMATREKHATVSSPSHFRPMSVDETQFESLGSRSFKSTGSFSPRTSLTSSLDSDPSENLNLPKEDLGEKKSSHGPSSSSSPSPPARRRTEQASSQAFHSRGYSVGSLLQGGLKSSLKDEWIDLDGSVDQSNNKETGLHLQSDTEKHRSLSKGPPKGKSVRTRRNSELTSETMRTGDMHSKQTDGKVEKKPDNVESVLIRREKSRKGGSDYPSKVINKQNSDLTCPKPEGTISSYPKRDKEEPSKNVAKEDLHIEPESSKRSLDEDRMSECINDSGLDSEVDKKASEFIAKFKAQIRLQKEASMDRSRGLKTMKRVLGDT